MKRRQFLTPYTELSTIMKQFSQKLVIAFQQHIVNYETAYFPTFTINVTKQVSRIT